MVKGKEKFALWITPECKQLVDDCYADDQCQSRSEYIEKAILFYTGFLYAEKADRYLPKVLQQILSGTLERFAERIGRQLFKLAVEQNVNNHKRKHFVRNFSFCIAFIRISSEFNHPPVSPDGTNLPRECCAAQQSNGHPHRLQAPQKAHAKTAGDGS